MPETSLVHPQQPVMSKTSTSPQQQRQNVSLQSRDRILRDLAESACPSHADVTVTVGNEVYLLNRHLLASFSPYFNAMFNSSFRESSQSSVRLHDVDSEPFQVLINFMSGEDTMSGSSHDLILAAVDLAEIICVDLYVSYYEEELDFNLGNLDLTLAYKLCKRLRKSSLCDAILNTVEDSLLDMHYRASKMSRDVRVFSETTFELLSAAIQRPRSKLLLTFDPEIPCTCSRAEKYLDGVLHWVGVNPDERFQNLEELLRLLSGRGLTEYTLVDAAVRVLGQEAPLWLRQHVQRVIEDLVGCK